MTSSHAANLYNFKKLPYDPIKDFTPVALLQPVVISFLWCVRNRDGRTVAQLTAAMKPKGTKASYGYGSPPALASGRALQGGAGLRAVGIPYSSSIDALSEMFSGELHFQFIDSTRAAPLIEGGRLRGLGVTSPARAGVDLPTMAEAAGILGSISRRCGASSCRRGRPRRSWRN